MNRHMKASSVALFLAFLVSVLVAPGGAQTPVLVKDLGNPSIINYLVDVGGTLFMNASDGGTEGTEPWISDGTEVGTHLIKDIWSWAGYSSQPCHWVDYNGIAMFQAEDEYGHGLYISDGTEAGTYKVFDCETPNGMTLYNNIVYFQAVVGSDGAELYRSDGTVLGTYLVKDINPGSGYSSPHNFHVAGGRALLRRQHRCLQC